MKKLLPFILLLVSSNSFAQQRPYLGWTIEKIKTYLVDDKNLVYEDTWQSSDKSIICISYQKTDDPTTSVLFYFKGITGICFEHSIMMGIDKLPETVKKFNTIYKREDEGSWKNDSGDTKIKIEYKMGDYSFRVNYTN